MMQVQIPKFAKISSDFICIYENITGGWGSAPNPIVTAVCLMTRSWKNAFGVLESPEIFVTKRVGTLFLTPVP